MKTNLSNIRLQFNSIASATFTVTGGGAGYIDTNVSATTGTDTSKIWVCIVKSDASQSAGVRVHGDANDIKKTINQNATWLTKVDAAGHCDLYRNAADNAYTFVGYLQ